MKMKKLILDLLAVMTLFASLSTMAEAKVSIYFGVLFMITKWVKVISMTGITAGTKITTGYK